MRTKKLPRRLRRAESFLGVHFDFHAGPDCRDVGRHVTPHMIHRLIDLVRPDYVQCDGKGHPGLSSYPTRVGHRAPGFVRDPLRVWRDVTAKRGVALYVHYSGVQDHEAIRRHPSWARVGADGKRDAASTSVFGPYVDRLLIPQLKELGDQYEVDGVWVDGECWSAGLDYGKRVLEEFRRETGIRSVPRKPGDPHFLEFAEFCREGFRRYLRYYVNELHRHNPDFQVASNWAFSSFMPEPVTADVDFLSGDYPPANSVNAARLEARCLARQGRPWDLMAWGFAGSGTEGARSTKSAVQLMQEAAVVLALGGGFQVYLTQKRDGSVRDWEVETLADVARFCRARQPFCHRAEAVPQVALVYSRAAHCRRPTTDLLRPWSGQLTALGGVLRALLDAQLAVEITMEHHLADRMNEYPLIVVPEWDYLKPYFKRDLLDYVRQGGNLLLVGPASAELFADHLGVRFAGPTREREQWLEHGGRLAGLKTVSRPARLKRAAQGFGRLFAENDVKGPWHPAASIVPCGRGRLAATYVNFGERYARAATPTARDFLGALGRELLPAPLVEVTGSHAVDVVPTRVGGKLAVNLVNTAGPHACETVRVFDEVPPVGPLEVILRTGRRPRAVALQPAGRPLAFTFAGGAVRLTLPRLEIHDIIVVE